jgi:ABC-type nitrate/sulfonate/bicarbonate transport system permease component
MHGFLLVCKRATWGAGGIGMVLACWWIASLYFPPVKLPSPIEVAEVLVSLPFHTPYTDILGGNPPGMIDDITVTIGRALVGHVLGTIIGVAIGFLLGWKKMLRLYIEPMIEVIRVAPPLIYLTFFILWFGVSTFSILFLIIAVTFLRISISTLHAAYNVKPVYRHFARTLGASEGAVYRSVVIPAAIPEIVGPLRAMIPYNFGATLVAELLGAQQGIGYQLMNWVNFSLTSRILAGLMFISISTVIVDYLQYHFLRYVTRWKER